MTDTLWGAVIVAAGSGSRFGGDVPKQFTLISGERVINYSVRVFSSLVDHLVVVTPAGDEWHRWWTPPPGVDTVHGGRRRQDSVMNGLKFLHSRGVSRVLIHDGARPLADTECVLRVMEALNENVAVIPVIPVRDTVKKVSGNTVEETLPRDELRLSQTPQGFHLPELMEVLADAGDITDEASAFEDAGREVNTVEGSWKNIKITDSSDGELVSLLAGKADRVIGTGLDFHPFDSGRPLYFCGCRLSDTDGLMGHSDGDVVLHAVADAILSASRMGDIGTLFPASDSRWKNADSSLLLGSCVAMVKRAGWEIQRLDVTVIGERPKISPVRELLIHRLAEITDISPEKIWIKGTTTNTIGDLARGTGVGCSVLTELVRRSP
ncbi:MAG: 2-C-methyl-D-erythritol 4-phosphate cytidylyltransferase [Candidatus Fermentibacteraceae bacterium]|nr:2-C-methyl-D-erythritol 4-phosphate cytidylyltransferase [Candidatus Fermentibacteraceae bacterium]